ncbi:MAG TPA: GTPase Era [Ignavibacteria bacterium]|nr:GTPase Era [Ignavibacteria bacterium]
MKTKCGYVCLFGLPNAGKSTLMNAMIGMNLSIVNKKPQTTRNKILGILTENDYQIIFTDVPGILEPKYEMQTVMANEIRNAMKGSDVIAHIVDVSNFDVKEFQKVQEQYGKFFKDKKYILVLNKIDAIDQDKLVEIGNAIKETYSGDVIPVSAKEKFNIDTLKRELVNDLPEGEFLFNEDEVTDKSERFYAAEIIRQSILELLSEEIPYSVFINITEFQEREAEGKPDYINADIIVERESQKGIILGKGGSMIKKIGESSRIEIEKMLGRRVFLKLFVKVRKDWRKDKRFLKENF